MSTSAYTRSNNVKNNHNKSKKRRKIGSETFICSDLLFEMKQIFPFFLCWFAFHLLSKKKTEKFRGFHIFSFRIFLALHSVNILYTLL